MRAKAIIAAAAEFERSLAVERAQGGTACKHFTGLSAGPDEALPILKIHRSADCACFMPDRAGAGYDDAALQALHSKIQGHRVESRLAFEQPRSQSLVRWTSDFWSIALSPDKDKVEVLPAVCWDKRPSDVDRAAQDRKRAMLHGVRAQFMEREHEGHACGLRQRADWPVDPYY